jgi:alcohol dehydrogenase (nicotinoprotein)
MRTNAAIIREPGKPWQLTELELDEPRRGEVRIRFAASGMCHSDEHLRTGDATGRLPLVGGHEGAGVVEAAGDGVTRVSAGDHVVCSFIPACGVCRYCSTGRQNLCDQGAQMVTGMLSDGSFRFHDDDGADLGGFCMLGTFAERAVVSQASCVKIDDDIPFDVAALTGCGVPTGWGTSVYAAGVRAGDTVVIFGAGGVGSNAVQGAAYAGAERVVVVDPVAFKRDKALEFGATHVFASADEAQQAVVELTWGQLADHAIITVGVLSEEVVSQAAAIVGKGGQVTITSVGRSGEQQIRLAANGAVVGYQRRIQGHVFGMCNPLHDIPKLLRLYRSGQLKLDELITRRYPLAEINAGYQDLADGTIIRGVIMHGAG